MPRRARRLPAFRFAMALALAGLGLVATAAAQGTKPKAKPAGYHLVRTLPIGGAEPPSAFTIDGAAGRIYVVRSTEVAVLETATGKEVGSMSFPESRHAVALAPDLKLGFVSHAASDALTAFDLATAVPTFEAKTGGGPTSACYDASLQRVFTVNEKSCDVTAIDAKSGAVLGSVALGAPPGEAAGDGKGRLYVANVQKNEVVVVDLKKLEVAKRFPVEPQKLLRGIAVDPASHRLFLGVAEDQLAVVSAESGKSVATLLLRREVRAVAFDPGTQCLLARTGDRSLSVIHLDSPDRFTVVEHVATDAASPLFALDPKSHEVALLTGAAGELQIQIYGK
ncbi:MAG TPA: YncE family protein [Planctomycetota bacterium]|nr:YncE family protein [Planctomycetota bacterium]